MENNSSSKKASIGLLGFTFLILFTLKLAKVGDVATMSWWWVTAPLWVPVCLGVFIFIVMIILSVIKHKKQAKDSTNPLQPKKSRFQERLEQMQRERQEQMKKDK